MGGGVRNNVIFMTPFTYMFINPLLGLRICLTFCYLSYPKLLIFCRNRVIIFSQLPQAPIFYDTFYFSSFKKRNNQWHLPSIRLRVVGIFMFNSMEQNNVQVRQTTIIYFPGVPGFKPRPGDWISWGFFFSFRYFFPAQVATRRPVSAKARLPS